MNILVHICCGPCAIYPVETLRQAGHDLMGYFFNPNIHPYTEWKQRKETLSDFARQTDLKLILNEDYQLESFLQAVAFRESTRCRVCYHLRLQSAALVAKKGKFDAFSTTLLYSKFQKHEQIREIGEAVGQSLGIAFYYGDFRKGWKAGIEKSKEMGLYRQPYCGCIYSEKERYFRPGQKEKKEN